MKAIIIIKNKLDGYKLKSSLSNIRDSFVDIQIFTKDDIISSSAQIKDSEAIYSSWNMPEFTEDEVEKYLPSVKAIFYAAGAVNYFAEPFLNRGIRVFSAANANSIPVAEFVVAQIVLANKGYFQAQKICSRPFWKLSFDRAKQIAEKKHGNYNAKVGIIGCGSIGSKVVSLLNPYKLEILVYDPYLPDSKYGQLGIKKTSIEEIFQTCDVISNHLPNNLSTIGIINYELFSKMKSAATFINSGRGAQVVESDLAKVLKQKPDVCALLDVTRHEPLFPWSSLFRRKNLFISPHIAGSISYEYDRMVEYMVKAADDFKFGLSNDCEVKLESLKIKD